MSKGKNPGRTVSKRDDGQWANTGNGNQRATDLHPTQKAAVDAARDDLKKSGGGELTTLGVDGKIRSKDTIAPGNDPNPPKDKEN
jgi:hypothetical protein